VEIDDAMFHLAEGPLYRFADWPNADVPKFGAGVYTIWHDDGRLIYAGMSGRSIKRDTEVRARPYGLYTRLHSHVSGRRSGDQFCVYVADRLVLSLLTATDIDQIASGRHSMDPFVRRYIHEHLSYRFAMVNDGATAFDVERRICTDAWGRGVPLLNMTRS
jgi:hypothetical protein